MKKIKVGDKSYAGVSVRIICHKCGQGMKHEIAKTRCEYCDHSLGMFPRVVYEDDKAVFEVIV